MKTSRAYLSVALLLTALSCAIWHPLLQAGTKKKKEPPITVEQVRKNLEITAESSLSSIYDALLEALRTQFNSTPINYTDLMNRLQTLEKHGFQKFQHYNGMQTRQYWVNSDEWEVLSTLNNIVVKVAPNQKEETPLDFTELMADNDTLATHEEWMAIEELLKRCTEFLVEQREHIMDPHQYNFTLMRKQPLRPDNIFLPELNLNQSTREEQSRLMRLWYDGILLGWADAATLAHAAPETAKHKPIDEPPLLNWRNILETPPLSPVFSMPDDEADDHYPTDNEDNSSKVEEQPKQKDIFKEIEHLLSTTPPIPVTTTTQMASSKHLRYLRYQNFVGGKPSRTAVQPLPSPNKLRTSAIHQPMPARPANK